MPASEDPAVEKAALDRALTEQDDLLLVYQPIHDARSGEIVSAEALLRQRRQNGEIREAAIINEAAEKSPDLFVLDSILVRKAYSAAAQWQTEHPDVRINVNLSPREFQEGNVLARLTPLVTDCGVDPRLVNLEITETSYIEHPDETVAALDELRSLGLRLWLDDFGTGHSSLTHLQHFHLDGLKIPGAFVRDMLDHPRSRAIVRHVIALAHDAGLEVVAEEIEQQQQLDLLRELGCDLIQGFLFSRPMELDDFLATLATRSSSSAPRDRARPGAAADRG